MSPEFALRELLAGGDRRSIARSKRAGQIVERSPRRIAELVVLTSDPDWLIRERALDQLEKFARTHPSWIQPHRGVFLGPLHLGARQSGRVRGHESTTAALDSPPPRAIRELLEQGETSSSALDSAQVRLGAMTRRRIGALGPVIAHRNSGGAAI